MPLRDPYLRPYDLSRCRVARAFRGDRDYAEGEIVDASGWRLGEKLVAQRRLVPLPPESEPEPATPKRVRDAK